jgi:predicted kinase
MQLIIFSGLPGTGKSYLAETAASTLKIPVFAKDWLEATLLNAGLSQTDRLGYAGYELLTTLAQRQLQFGQSVILDSVASFERIRAQWRNLAQAYGADWRVIECVCSDTAVHRARLNGRQRHIPGWHELTWADVGRVRGYYEPWAEERLVVDGVRPFPNNLQAVLTYLQHQE